jgi:hypothetical protein
MLLTLQGDIPTFPLTESLWLVCHLNDQISAIERLGAWQRLPEADLVFSSRRPLIHDPCLGTSFYSLPESTHPSFPERLREEHVA